MLAADGGAKVGGGADCAFLAKGGVTKGICPVADPRLGDDEGLDFAQTRGGVDRASADPCVAKMSSKNITKEGAGQAIDEDASLVVTGGAVDVEGAEEALYVSLGV